MTPAERVALTYIRSENYPAGFTSPGMRALLRTGYVRKVYPQKDSDRTYERSAEPPHQWELTAKGIAQFESDQS